MTLVTVIAGLPASYGALLRANREAYAERFCYEYCHFEHKFDAARHAAWSKVAAVRHLLEEHNRTQLVVMDADAVIINHKPFEGIADAPGRAGKDVVWSTDVDTDAEDVARASISTAVFVVRNTLWSRRFWRRIWSEFPEALEHPWWEQLAVIQFRSRHPQEFAEHSGIVGHSAMNTGGFFEKADKDTFIYHKGGGALGGAGAKYRFMEGYLRGLELGKQVLAGKPWLSGFTDGFAVGKLVGDGR